MATTRRNSTVGSSPSTPSSSSKTSSSSAAKAATGAHAPLTRVALGVVLAALASFAFGVVVWGVMTLPYSSWKSPADTDATRKLLLDTFPADGIYYYPPRSAADFEARHEAGPVVMVHMTGRSGFSMADPMMPVKGIALYLVMSAVLAIALRIANLKTWGQRACLVSVLGLAAAVSLDIGDAVWWHMDVMWVVTRALYDFGAITVAGWVLAVFVH